MTSTTGLFLCISLGGTKIQLGALTPAGLCLRACEVLWRERLAPSADDETTRTRDFLDFLGSEARRFRDARGLDLSDVALIGVAFPGPRVESGWQSNNLPAPFRDGVDLAGELSSTIAEQCAAAAPPPVRVVFDAQCDAGGELYHPRGRLHESGRVDAAVLNLATGIAAGLVADGTVVIGDAAFRTHVGPEYDGGAGQLGRHLWYHVAPREWRYHFLGRGQTPEVRGAVRMTERLSGPALAARLLLRLLAHGLLAERHWSDPEVDWEDIAEFIELARGASGIRDEVVLARQMRDCPRPLAGALHRWAERESAMESAPSAALQEQLVGFGQEIALDLAAALAAWSRAPGWRRFTRHIVLTGGVGIRFLAASDNDPMRGFLARLRAAASPSTRIERSILTDAIERECYLFRGQPL